MATTESQTRWRRKNRFVKKQLNVMARGQVHGWLEDVGDRFALRGKGEAVAFSAFVVQWLMQQSAHNGEAARLLELLSAAYHADRELYAP
ncbi:hypothetical protein [Caenispirillum bisanense]|uniref:hypothetical protein n=1 Tax=Caenispirillum bisanense TaxID=414052 RepID=UPI0031DE6F18